MLLFSSVLVLLFAMRQKFSRQKISVNSLNFVNNLLLVYFFVISAVYTPVKLSNYFHFDFILLRFELYCSIVILFELIADCLKCCLSEFCSCISRSQIVVKSLHL